MKNAPFVLSLVAAVATIALATPPAMGQQAHAAPTPTSPLPLSSALSGPAKDAYASAQMLMNNSDPAAAYAKYEQAYALSKDPRLLFNMAVCARSLKAYARMQSLLTRYERESGPALTASDKTDVDNAIAAIKNLVGTLTVTASEAGAAVTVDGESQGTTPLAEPLVLDLGKHTLSLTKEGFERLDDAVVIAGGTQAALALKLVAQVHGAALTISSDDDATVSIDGAVVGKGRFTGPLSSGPHDIRVAAAGKKTRDSQIELRDGETRTMQLTLEDEKHGGPLWPWVVGGAVAVAGAAVGGYFLFKPSDTTTGVPQGKFGSVTFASWRP